MGVVNEDGQNWTHRNGGTVDDVSECCGVRNPRCGGQCNPDSTERVQAWGYRYVRDGDHWHWRMRHYCCPCREIRGIRDSFSPWLNENGVAPVAAEKRYFLTESGSGRWKRTGGNPGV